MPDFVETVTVFSGHKDEKHDYILAQQPADAAVARPDRHARVPRLALAREGGSGCASKSTDYASSLEESLEASVLNYPDYLVFDIDPYIYSGKEATGAEPELNKKGFAGRPARRVLAARAAEADVARSGGEDVRQDRPARVRADRAHGDVR